MADEPGDETGSGFADLSDDELYEQLGVWLLPDSSTLGPADLRRTIDVGRAWFTNHLDELREAVCSDPRIVHLRDRAESDTAEWLAAIADILSTKGGYPPVVVVANLTFRYGVDRLCA